MTTAQIGERKRIYNMIRTLPDDKAARVLSYIQAIQSEEPPLNEDEEEGLRVAYAELAVGKGQPLKDVLAELR